jgi:hypothetical protein
MLNKELVNYQNKLYWVYRKVNQSHIDMVNVTELRDYWLCDITLKQKTSQNSEVLLFLREIPEAEVINQT